MRNLTKKLSLLTIALGLVSSTIFGGLLTTPANASANNFNPSNIIDDSVMTNPNTMSASQIQSFLNSKLKSCDTNGAKMYSSSQTRKQYAASRGVKTPFTCLKDYREGGKSAAQLIKEKANKYKINPQVLIVLLQKEQGLVTDDWPWPVQYRTAAGYGCPDTAPCDAEYFGLANQLDWAAKMFRSIVDQSPGWYSPYVRGYNPTVYWHPDTGRCGGQSLNVQNWSTASMYSYTPYRPNQAALNAGYGEGNSCSSYGNRNFFLYFNDWFGATSGTPFFKINDGSGRIYIEGVSGTYYYVPSTEVLRSYGYGTAFHHVANVSKSHVNNKTMAGNLSYIVRFESDPVYLINGQEVFHLPDRETVSDYGYAVGQESKLPSDFKKYFTDKVATDILMTNGAPEVYLVEQGKKHHITSQSALQTQGNPVYSSKDRISMSREFVNRLQPGHPILIANTLVYRSDNRTYGLWDGTSLQDISSSIASETGLPIHYRSTSAIINQLPLSQAPQIDRYIKDTANNLYIVNGKEKLKLSGSSLPHTGVQTGSFVEAQKWLVDRLSTKDFSRAIRINNGSEVYWLESSKLRHVTDRDVMSEKGFTMSDVLNINSPTSKVFSIVPEKLLSQGSLFRIGSSDPVYLVGPNSTYAHAPSISLLNAYGLSIHSTNSYTSSHVGGYTKSTSLSFFTKKGDAYWHVDKKIKRPISIENISSYYGIDSASLFEAPDSTLASLSSAQKPLGNLLRADGQDRVYLAKDGKIHWIATRQAFDSRGYDMSQVTQVSSEFLKTLPISTKVTN